MSQLESNDVAPNGSRWANDLGRVGLVIDLTMVTLAIANLLWIIFDSAWLVPELRNIMAFVMPLAWLDNYSVVNERFFRIDLVFVSIFITEFLSRWMFALYKKTYGHWLAYPVLHWYDILGCIPVAEFRWLRILRIYVVLVRFKEMGIVDFTQWAPYRWVKSLYNIVIEEISDRVVVNVLDGVQDELRSSVGVEKQVLNEVVRPRQAQLTELLRERIVIAVQAVHAQSRDDLRIFVTEIVGSAVDENREIKIIDRIPLVGGVMGDLLNNAITDIVCRVIDQGVGRLNDKEFAGLFTDAVDAVLTSLSSDSETDHEMGALIIDILDVVKRQVSRRRWIDGVE